MYNVIMFIVLRQAVKCLYSVSVRYNIKLPLYKTQWTQAQAGGNKQVSRVTWEGAAFKFFCECKITLEVKIVV